MTNLFKFAVACTALPLGLLLFMFWATSPQISTHVQDSEIIHFSSQNPEQQSAHSVTQLTVMTWNIAYGYGGGSDGGAYKPHGKQEFESRLEKIAGIILDNAVDIVLLQEIDFNSDRSHNVDQLQTLARKTGLTYGAYAVSWNANYIPFPYWPPESHFGRVLSGGAVLSRFPIDKNEVMLHPKPASQPWWYQIFYLSRYTQKTRLDLGNQQLWVLNNHLEAYDSTNREGQARTIKNMIGAWEEGSPLVLFAGDMNAVPEYASSTHDFPGYPEDDYRDDETIQLLSQIEGYAELVSDPEYRKNESLYLTFPAVAPDRRLDYLFASTAITVESFRVIKTGELSDHLPIVATLTIQ